MAQDKTGGFRGRAGGNKETIRVSRKGRSPPIHGPSIVTFSVGNTARESFNEGFEVGQVQTKNIFLVVRIITGGASYRGLSCALHRKEYFKTVLILFPQKRYALLQTEINSRSSIAAVMLKITMVPSGFADCPFQVSPVSLKRCLIISYQTKLFRSVYGVPQNQ